MSEDVDVDDWESESDEVPQTGITELDDVIRAVASLNGDAIEEHVVTLESAQVTLRRALDQPRDAS